MHYKNGREAKNGDRVIVLDPGATPRIGILYGALPGNDHCNGYLAEMRTTDHCATLSKCLHIDDALRAIANVPAWSEEAPGPSAPSKSEEPVDGGAA